MTLPKGYLSPSQLTGFDLCEIRYRIFNAEGAVAPTDFFLETKKLFHAVVLEKDLAQKIESGKNLADSDLSELYRAEMESTVFQAAKEDPNLEEEPAKAVQDEVSYFDKILPAIGDWRRKVHPLKVEESLEGTIGGVPVKGRLDLIADETIFTRILDLKRQGQAPAKGSAAKSRQLGTYAALKGIPDVGFAAVVENKTPKLAEEPGQVSAGDLKRLEKAYQGAAFKIENAVKSDIWTPVDHGDPRKSWVCSAKFCGAWRIGAKDIKTGRLIECEYGEKQSVSIAVNSNNLIDKLEASVIR